MKHFASLAAILGALAVGLGAFGAHGLKAIAPPEALAWWHTGAHYHLIHAVALFALSVHPLPRARMQRLAAWAMVIGIAIFSGSLYVMTLTGLRWLGAITPLGGVSFIVGWLMLAAAVRPMKNHGEGA